MEQPIVNKVAQSRLITINPEDFYPVDTIVALDLKDYLYMEVMLKEKEFREAMKSLDTTVFEHKTVAITCTTDAIIPLWAYMLVAATIQPIAHAVYYGSGQQVFEQKYLENLDSLDAASYAGKRVILKGCGQKPIPAAVYTKLTTMLLPHAKSLMYGEACSTVPVYKQK